MPRPTIATLILFPLALGCGRESRSATDAGKDPGARLFAAQGCATCHGKGGEGGMLGPRLVGVAPHWTRASLIEFLADPRAFAATSPRIAEQARRYMSPMQSFRALPEEDRGALADFVLGLQ